MIKYTIIVFGLFYCSLAFGADSTAIVRPEPPIRLYDRVTGAKFAPQYIPIIHEMDCDPYGWRWNAFEWPLMKRGLCPVPRYRNNVSGHGSNGGYSFG